MSIPIYKQLGLTDSEYEEIVTLLKRTPNNIELAMFSVMWSEHCCYKSSRQYLKQLPTESERVVVGPGENAGVLDLGDDLLLACRIESHNHPCAIEPFQGAATGVGGIIRDIFTMGARPIALGDSIYVGPLSQERNARTLENIVGGISSYGNSVGVPTLGGELHFDSVYTNNPLVNVFCLGLLKREHLVLAKAHGPGNLLVLLGAHTGKDGIGGVSILASSAIESSDQKQKLPSVQVGDPYEEKRLIEACLELFYSKVVLAIQDLGGAGLTCASSELAAKGLVSVEINVDNVPLREPLEPLEIMLSESQERMLAVVKPENLKTVLEVAKKWEINANVIGRITHEDPDPALTVINSSNEVLAKVPAIALASGPTKCIRNVSQQRSIPIKSQNIKKSNNQLKTLLLNSLIDYSWVYSQYDHELFLNTLIPPGKGAFLIKASAPLIGEYDKAIAVSLDGNPLWCATDPELGTYLTVIESAVNVAITGAKPIGCVNCLNFGSPEKPDVMRDFISAVQGLNRACSDLNIPIIGGNVSFYNESDTSQIYPTPVVGVIGLIQDFRGSLASEPILPGDKLYLAGIDSVENYSLGGSKLESFETPLPKIKIETIKRLLNFLIEINKKRREYLSNLFKEIQAVNQGGVVLKLAEFCLQHSVGITINENLSLEELLCEAPGRVLIASSCSKDLEKYLDHSGLEFNNIGIINGQSLKVADVMDLSLGELRQALSKSLNNL